MDAAKTQPLTVFNIREVAKSDKPFWDRIGVAFRNRDGSLNVQLNSLPLDGKLHIRESKPAPANNARS